MKDYLELMERIMEEGVDRDDRTGTGTRALFGCELRCDLADGLPMVTTKRVHFASIAHELLWFLAGQTSVRPLQAKGVRIWDPWANDDGDLGPVYGKQWRSWDTFPPTGPGIDQIAKIVADLRTRPHSRRMLLSSWNVGALPHMALEPCHVLAQFQVTDNRLSCLLFQRSADSFLGLPFNRVSYALLTMMLAQVTGHVPGDIIHILGDTHIYHNHFEQVRTQLRRVPYPPPTVRLNPKVREIDDFRFEDFDLVGYRHHPAIAAPVAV